MKDKLLLGRARSGGWLK